MKKHRYLISLFLCTLLISCTTQSPISSSTNSGPSPSSSDSNTLSTEDDFDKGYESINIEAETYFLICEGLYVNKKPGLYRDDFALKFAYNQNKGKLYFNYAGEKPIENDLCYLPAFKALEIYENIPENQQEIPLTVSVDEILDSYNNRCVSYNYINNIQNPQEYAYFHNACVVDITFVYKQKTTNMSLTYLVDSENEYTLPLIFLSMPYRKWFGSPYYFYNNIYEEVEQRVQLEYFDPITSSYWQRNSKIKLGGGWSKGYPQRTLNLNFKKDELGNKNEKVGEPIFGDRKTCGDINKDLDKHLRFRLHNGGNCFEQWSGFNDAILQRAMFASNVSTTAYRPCLVYLNGEYWGMMSLREHYCDYYLQQNYGVDDDNVTMFELKGNLIYDDGDEGGLALINQLNTFLNDGRFFSNNQNQIEAAYQELCEMIDIDSFIDALLCEYYCCNWDYVGNLNNLKMWRVMETSSKPYEDGKWRFCLHDADFAFTENTNFFNKYVDHSYNNWPLVRDCMLSKTFRKQLIDRANELASSHLSAENLQQITSQMYEEVKPYKADSGRRWGQPSSYYNEWLNYQEYLSNYFVNRTNNFVNDLKNIINGQYGGY